MEASYAIRKRQLLDECQVSPEIFEHVIPRLYSFMKPFVTIFQGQVGDQHAKTYVCGLLSDVKHKNIESSAYRFDHSRLPLQAFIGWEEWDDEPLRLALRHQVKTHLGQGDGVLVFDPSGFPKSGCQSVGVARQWCGRLGKVDNCQVGVFMGYVGEDEHALLDFRLSLPQEWACDEQRRQACHVPPEVRYQTRQAQCLEMLDQWREHVPHGWVTGDEELGRHTRFRGELRERGERAVVGVAAAIPLGACLLPAFMLLGVVPTVPSGWPRRSGIPSRRPSA